MPAPPAIGAKLSVENYGRRPEPPRDQDDYEDDKLVLAHCGPPLPAAYEHSIPLPIGCKGLVKGVLRNFYVLNRMPIHPSVWNRCSRKFTCRILHNHVPIPLESPSPDTPHSPAPLELVTPMDRYAELRILS